MLTVYVVNSLSDTAALVRHVDWFPEWKPAA